MVQFIFLFFGRYALVHVIMIEVNLCVGEWESRALYLFQGQS